jgi:SOS-response transcriptional repressor LexA
LGGRLERALGLGAGRPGRWRGAATSGDDPPGGGGVGPPLSAGRPVPVINSVAAGYPRDFTDLDYPPHVADEYVLCPDVADAQAFAARVIGDSMAPRFREGDIVVFSPNASAHDGQACFVRFADTGETAFKAVYLDDDDDGTIRLQPLNPAYSPQRVNRDRINGLYPAIYRIERVE